MNVAQTDYNKRLFSSLESFLRIFISILILISFDNPLQAKDVKNNCLAPKSICMEDNNFIDNLQVKKEFLNIIIKHFKGGHYNEEIIMKSLVLKGFVINDILEIDPSYYIVCYTTTEGIREQINIQVRVTGRGVIKPLIKHPDEQTWYYYDNVDILNMIGTPQYDLEDIMDDEEYLEEVSTKDSKKNLSFRQSVTVKVLKAVCLAGFYGSLVYVSYLHFPVIISSLAFILLLSCLVGVVSLLETSIINIVNDPKSIIYLKSIAENDKSIKRVIKAKRALEFLTQISKKLPSVIFSKNAVSIPSGIFISKVTEPLLEIYHLPKIFGKIFSSFIILIFGETIPKDLGTSMNYDKKLNLLMNAVPLLNSIEKLFFVLVWVMQKTTGPAIWLSYVFFNLKLPAQKKITPGTSEIKRILKDSWLEGSLSDSGYNYLSGILAFENYTLNDVLFKHKKHKKVFSLPPLMSVIDAYQVLKYRYYSRFPVIDKSGKCFGVISRNDVLIRSEDKNWKNRSLISLYNYLERENQSIELLKFSKKDLAIDVLKVLINSRSSRKLALVLGKNEKVISVFTKEDLVEALFQKDVLDETDLRKNSKKPFSPTKLSMYLIKKEVKKRSRLLKKQIKKLDKRKLETKRSFAKEQDISRLQNSLKFLSDLDIMTLIDLFWAESMDENELNNYIYFGNISGYLKINEWIKTDKEYKVIFSIFSEAFKKLKKKNPAYSYDLMKKDFNAIYNLSKGEYDSSEFQKQLQRFPSEIIKTATFLYLSVENMIKLKEISLIVRSIKRPQKQNAWQKFRPYFSSVLLTVSFSLMVYTAFLVSVTFGNFIFVLLLVSVLNGLTSATESSIFSVERSMVEKQAFKGDSSSFHLLSIIEQLDKYIPVMVLFNNLVKISGGIYIAEFGQAIFGRWGGVAFSTFWIALFVKQIPKYYGIKYSFSLAKNMSVVVVALRKILLPFVYAVQFISKITKYSLNILTLEKLSALQNEGKIEKKEGFFLYSDVRKKFITEVMTKWKQWKQNSDISNLFDDKLMLLFDRGLSFFGESPETLTIGEILEHKMETRMKDKGIKKDIFHVSALDTINQAYQKIENIPFFRIPISYVTEEGELVYSGYVFRDDIIMALKEGKGEFLVSELSIPIEERSANFPANKILESFLSGTTHVFIVKDMVNGFSGIISLSDIIDYLLRPINDNTVTLASKKHFRFAKEMSMQFPRVFSGKKAA